MTYSDDEISAHASRPLELFEFIGPVTTWRYASGDESTVLDGNVYTALAGLVRSSLGISSSKDTAALLVDLPVSSPVVQQYGFAIPPRNLRLKMHRLQARSGEYETKWDGKVLAFTPKGRIAVARSVSALGERLDTNIPGVTVSRMCGHVFGDARCRINLETYRHNTTVASASGLNITLSSRASTELQVGAYRAGKIVRLADGEERTIVYQESNTPVFKLSSPFRTIANGDFVALYTGCDHYITTCQARYGNKDNFGGHPAVPTSNPFRTSIKINGDT